MKNFSYILPAAKGIASILIGVCLIITNPTFLSARSMETNQNLELDKKRGLSYLRTGKVKLPELSLKIISARGKPYVLREDAKKWVPAKKGMELHKGARIVTEEKDELKLEIPGISLVELTEKTEIKVEKLIRKQSTQIDRQGILRRVREKQLNEIKLKMYRGKVFNSLRKIKNHEVSYQLESHTAVAGVRGTTFSCEVEEGKTSCSVLEGEVNFRSLFDPTRFINLNEGIRGNVGFGARTPDTTTQINKESKQKMEQNKTEAKKELLLPPEFTGLQVDESAVDTAGEHRYRARVDYYRPRTLAIKGEVRVREEGTTLARVTAGRGGETLPIRGRKKWQVELKPDTVSPGQQREIKLYFQAADDSGTRSDTHYLLLTLRHPDSEQILPVNYNSGTVPVVLSEAGQAAVSGKFPLHVFSNQLNEGSVLRLLGTVRSKQQVKGVAISLNRGITWEQVSEDRDWEARINLSSKSEQVVIPWLIAWTGDTIIGSVYKPGKIIYHNLPVKQHLRRQTVNFWEAVSLQDLTALKGIIHQNLRFKTAGGQAKKIQGMLTYFRELFRQTENLQLFYSHQDFVVKEGRGKASFSLEIQGKHSISGHHFKLVSPDLELIFTPDIHRKFKLSRITGFSEFLYAFNTRAIKIAPRTSLNLRTLSSRGGDKQVWVLKSRRGREALWAFRRSNAIQKGGIFRLNTKSLAKVFPIPGLSSSLYQQVTRIKPGWFYALNMVSGDGRRFVSLLKALEIKPDKIKLKIMSSIPVLE